MSIFSQKGSNNNNADGRSPSGDRSHSNIMFKFKKTNQDGKGFKTPFSSLSLDQQLQKRAISVNGWMHDRQPALSNNEQEDLGKILESRSTHQMKPERQETALSSPSTTIQSELEELVSKLDSHASTKQGGAHPILSMQSKDDYEKL